MRWRFDGLGAHETVNEADECELYHGGSWVEGHLQPSSLAWNRFSGAKEDLYITEAISSVYTSCADMGVGGPRAHHQGLEPKAYQSNLSSSP